MGRKLEQGINDFQSLFPEIAKDWDYEKNGELKPNMITYGSAYNVWWKCSIGHSWQSTVNRRTNQASGCPYCTNRKLLIGFNDFQTREPEVAEEWNYEKNGDLKPSDILVGSHQKVWWKCKKDHEWQAPIDRRTGKTKSKCPYCTKHYMAKGENDLLTTYPDIADEWVFEKNGDLKPDMVATASHEVVWWKCDNGHEWQAPVYRRTGKGKSGCPYCSGHFLLKGMNDLQTSFPEIVNEWNWEKNGELKPDMVAGSTNKKVWWKGVCGHEWQATVNSRTGRSKNGCPICANIEVLVGYNDLQSVYPDIAKEWNYEKNGDLKPDAIVYGSNKRVWWRCEKGHEWKTTPNHRVNRHDGCPQCGKEMKSSFPEQCIYYYLRKVFPDADRIEVESDLLGAARAVCQHQEGLACILGTGSNSCFYDGEKIVGNIPPMGYILGDEGSGAVLGKLFLNALFKGALPDGMKADFLQSSGLSYPEIIQRVYRQPMANRFLASTSLYISEHLDVPALWELVKQNFRDFFHKNIAQYGRHDLPVGAIGSIAYHYRDLLQEVAEEEGYNLSKIAKSPMEGLVAYHLMK